MVSAFTDGHLVCVLAQDVFPDENGYLVTGLPESGYGACTQVILQDSVDFFLCFNALLDGDSFYISDMTYFDPAQHTQLHTAFTIVYPVASS